MRRFARTFALGFGVTSGVVAGLGVTYYVLGLVDDLGRALARRLS